MVDDAVVPILAAQADVAFDRDRLKMPPREPHERGVERAAAEVINENHVRMKVRLWLTGRTVRHSLPYTILLKRICQRGGARLVENVDDVQSGDPPGVVRRLTPRIVEVGGNGNDRLPDRAEVPFRVLRELAKDDRRKRLRSELAVRDRAAVRVVAHAALDQRRDAVRLLQRDVEGGLTDDDLFAGEKDGAGSEHFAVAVWNRERPAPFIQGRNGGIGGAEIDADERHGDRESWFVNRGSKRDSRYTIHDTRFTIFCSSAGSSRGCR